ncbi:FAD-depdendent monooxygenase, putative [Eimeria maxima]|uniref:FAD-depdendent monooxygenase, putative n=1 Tax=Eimeria maxima TaxID=5804 RepID=U6M583_EIMMA|nr:FAD-depdendent monooxygenase, putative [Eimeria maxima]CDJ59397.1 FAD-depdendent monooxygenase, putative [Eimeria maxima]
MSTPSSSFSLPRNVAEAQRTQRQQHHNQQGQQQLTYGSTPQASIPPIGCSGLPSNSSFCSCSCSSNGSLPAYTDVVIVGAGPAGLTLALSLALQNVSFVLLDAAPQPQQESRALAVHARTLEILEDLGVACSFLTLGLRCQSFELWVSGKKSLSVPFRDTETAAAPRRVHRPVAVWQVQGFETDDPSCFPLKKQQQNQRQQDQGQQQQRQQQQQQHQEEMNGGDFDSQDDSDGSSFRSPHEVADDEEEIACEEDQQEQQDHQQKQQQQQQQQPDERQDVVFPPFAADGQTPLQEGANGVLGYPVSVQFCRYLPRGSSISCSSASCGCSFPAAAAAAAAAGEGPPVRFGVIFCRYVVGCDGAGSVVRKAGGISFEGRGDPQSFIVADLQLSPSLSAASSCTVSPAQSPVLGAAAPLNSSSPPQTPPSEEKKPRVTHSSLLAGAAAAHRSFALAEQQQQQQQQQQVSVDERLLQLPSWQYQQQQQQQREASSCQLLGCGGLGSAAGSMWGEGLMSGLGRRLHAAAAAALEPGETERARLMASGRRTAAGDAVEIHLTPKGFAACIPMLGTASSTDVALADASSRRSGSSSNSLLQQQLLHRRATRPADAAAFRWRVVTERLPSAVAAASRPVEFTDAAAGAAAAAATAAVSVDQTDRTGNSISRQETQAETQAELLQQVERIFVGCRVTEVYWAAVYKAGVRLAAAFRRKRLLLVGDAAHLHPSILGQGMNLGMQNAYNLGWKLARVLQQGASPQLLDSYAAEAREAAEQVVGLADRLFHAILSTNNSGGLVSRLLLRMGAAVASHLPSAARSFGQTLLMTQISYTQPSIALGNADDSFISGLRPGCRAPDCLVKVARIPRALPTETGDPVVGYLFELLGKGRHLLLLHIMLLPPGSPRYNMEAVSTLARLCQLAVLAAAKGASSAALPSPRGSDATAAASSGLSGAAVAPCLRAPFSAADFADDAPQGHTRFAGACSSSSNNSSSSGSSSGSESEELDDDHRARGRQFRTTFQDSQDGPGGTTPCHESVAAAAASAAADTSAVVGGRVLRRHTMYHPPAASASTSAAAAERHLWASDLRVVWCFHGPPAAVHTTATSTSITSEIIRGNSRVLPPARSRSLLLSPQQQQQQEQQRSGHGQVPLAPGAESGKGEVEECHLVERPLLQLLPPALLQQMQQASSSSSRGAGGFVLLDFLGDLASKFGLSLADPHASDGAEASCGFSLIRPDGYLAHCGRIGDTKAARGLLDYLIRF